MLDPLPLVPLPVLLRVRTADYCEALPVTRPDALGRHIWLVCSWTDGHIHGSLKGSHDTIAAQTQTVHGIRHGNTAMLLLEVLLCRGVAVGGVAGAEVSLLEVHWQGCRCDGEARA